MRTKPRLNYQFEFKPLSKKQLQVLTWWAPASPYRDKFAIVADGSVRAGKTVIMSLSYVMWGMFNFNGQNFGMAGKTIGSLRRNVIGPLTQMLRSEGFQVKDRRTDNYIEITKNGITNYFYLFGGKDEKSYQLVQGLTAAGFFFDEVVLQPQSFVNQATTRTSVKGAKLWFNGNPEGPYHWFKQDWIDHLTDKNAIRIHFTMHDNPSLDEETIERYDRLYSGVFYQRYILGLWVLSEGVIYDNFNKQLMSKDIPDDMHFSKYYVSCDYGTLNPTVFLLWGLNDGVWYCIKEYYYSGRETSHQRTDEQYASDLVNFLDGIKAQIIIDPSAASFITKLRSMGFSIIKANNDVLDGIRATQTALNNGQIIFNSSCLNVFKEFASYIWDVTAEKRGEDKPVKEHDHSMDAIRYFVFMVLYKNRTVKVSDKPSGLFG